MQLREVDQVLELFHPHILQQLVKESIDAHWDSKIYEGKLELEQEYQEFFNEKIEGMS